MYHNKVIMGRESVSQALSWHQLSQVCAPFHNLPLNRGHQGLPIPLSAARPSPSKHTERWRPCNPTGRWSSTRARALAHTPIDPFCEVRFASLSLG